MNHPINPLTDDGLRFLNDRLTDIRVALEDLRLEPQRGEAPVIERCERILPTVLCNELLAYLGAIEAHHEAICDVLYGSGADLRADGLVVDTSECTVCDPESPDRCNPVSSVETGVVDLSAYTERWHPCVESDCAKLVPFDDEPWCFTHSPDSGSSVRDYSWQRVNDIASIEHIERHHLLSAQFQRGILSSAELQAELVALVNAARGLDAQGLPL